MSPTSCQLLYPASFTCKSIVYTQNIVKCRGVELCEKYGEIWVFFAKTCRIQLFQGLFYLLKVSSRGFAVCTSGKAAHEAPGVLAGVGAAFVALVVYAAENIVAFAVISGKEL